MDSPTLNHISLCAGYGGIDLGLRRAVPNLRTVAFAEIEGFACANLVAKMEAGLLDAAPIWTDLKTFPYAKFRGLVDILSGGYPCQPFSAAGQRRGKDDPRHLWPWIADGIDAMGPAACFFENVEGHISLGLSDVVEDLARLGYRTTWGIFSAAEVGAPHQRKRVFILAHRNGAGLEGFIGNVEGAGWKSDGSRGSASASSLPLQLWPSRPGQPQFDWEPPRVVGNAEKLQRNGREYYTAVSERPQAISESGDSSGPDSLGNAESQRSAAFGAEHEGQQRESSPASASGGLGNAARGQPGQSGAGERWSGVGGTSQSGGNAAQHDRGDLCERHSPLGPEQSSGRQAEPALGGDAHGSPNWLGDAELFTSSDNRTDELRLLGNGVVPATAERAFRVLMEQLYAANT